MEAGDSLLIEKGDPRFDHRWKVPPWGLTPSYCLKARSERFPPIKP